MLDVFSVADALVHHIKTRYPNDVAIAAYYGSYAQGTATNRSDLDFFFIPATPEGYKVSLQFIVDGISFDFWPISWERAERMASFQESHTAIVADCKLLYVRTETDKTRFMELRETIREMQQPVRAYPLVERAEFLLHRSHLPLYRMQADGPHRPLSHLRMDAHRVLSNVLEALALLNRSYFDRGLGKNREQILQFTVRPVELEALMDTIMTSDKGNEILDACDRLVAEACRLVVVQKQGYEIGPSYRDRVRGFFEEEKGILDKILTACESKNYDIAFFAAVHAQTEIANFLYYAERGCWPSELDPMAQTIYDELGMPNLVELLDPHDFTPLRAAVEELSIRLETQFKLQGVEIHRFAVVEELRDFLSARDPRGCHLL